MRRREFISLLTGTIAAWPLAAAAQQQKSPFRLGFVPVGSPDNAYDRSLVEAFQRGLRQVGLVENQNIVLDVVWSGGDPDQAVTEVLRRGAELLITSGSSTSVAAKRQTSTIPIVFLHVGDPVAVGLIESLSRPGRNATGFSDILAELSSKFVDLAKELNKSQSSISYLWHTDWPDGQHRYALTREAAEKVELELRSSPITNIAQLNDALVTIKQRGATAFIVQPSPFTYAERGQIIAAAIKYGLGTIFAHPVAAKEGSLIGYGPDYLQMYSRAPIYVDRILKGTKPADLPVEQPTKIELLVNLKTAKALGIEVPLSLLIRADELIE
jgi:putative tryptophan/tyrosine transport system substrate-binding protein